MLPLLFDTSRPCTNAQWDKVTPEDLMDSIYVVEENDQIIGCGSIGPYWGRADESSLFTIFVRPGRKGKGIGRKIVETFEQDEYFLRAKKIEIPASITGTSFV